jgi:hypothetical protein
MFNPHYGLVFLRDMTTGLAVEGYESADPGAFVEWILRIRDLTAPLTLNERNYVLYYRAALANL